MWQWTAHANPIYQAERLHWQRSRNPRVLNMLSVLALGAVLVLFTVHRDTRQNGHIVLLAMIAIHTLHFIITFLAISFAYESITREQRSHSWDLLQITPLARKSLVMGKLHAILGWLTPLYLRLIGLKLIFLLWQLTQIYSKASSAIRHSVSFTFDFQNDEFWGISAAAVLFVIVYLLVDLLFTTALGMTAAMVMPRQGRRLGLAVGLLVRWWLPLLTLCGLLTYTFQDFDPLPTHWNSYLSLAARYTWHYGFDYVGIDGAVSEVFPALAITMPDGPLLVFMHTTKSWDIETPGVYFSILGRSLAAYLVLALGTVAISRLVVRRWYK